jgi:hypothetical protein
VLPPPPPIPISVTVAALTEDKVKFAKTKKDLKDEKKKQEKEEKLRRKELEATKKSKSANVSPSVARRSLGTFDSISKSSSLGTTTEPFALFDYVATDSRMISVPKGKNIQILDKSFSGDWCKIEYEGKTGYFPLSYVKVPIGQPKGFLEFTEEEIEEEEEEQAEKNLIKKAMNLQEGGVDRKATLTDTEEAHIFCYSR